MAKDPVCQMDVDPALAQFRTEYQGRTYYFCSKACQREFEENPLAYIGEIGVRSA